MRATRIGMERCRRGFTACVVLPAVVWSCGGQRTEAASPGAVVPVVVVADSQATTVALAAVVSGSGWEEAGTTGLTLLAARSLLEQTRPALEALGAEAAVECGRWTFVITLVAPRETWRVAAEVLEGALRQPDPSPGALDRARSKLAESLAMDRANPAWQARLASGRALYAAPGEESAWARPACGVVETLPLFDLRDVRRAAERFTPVRAAAVIGSVTGRPDSVAGTLFQATGGRPGVPLLPSPGRAEPGRIYVERNTITAWVSVSWPFGFGVDPEAVRVVGALLEDAVGPEVSRPGVLHVASEVSVHGDGGSLVVRAVVAPAEAAAVAEALEAGVARVAGEGVHRDVLERVLRRHRGVRLRELASPEARAARMAVALARGEEAAAWPGEESFTAAAVRAAAEALGPAARAVVGPRAARGAVVP